MDYQFLLELGAVLTFTAYGVKKGSEVLKSRTAIAVQKAKAKPDSFQGITGLITNAPQILEQMHKLRADQIKQGATPEALKPLDERIRQMEWIHKNQFWLQFVGPYADQIAGSVLGAVSKLAKSI